VARSRCSCGEILRWKADEPESDEWILVAKPDVPDEHDHATLAAVATSAAICSGCGRLWIAWGYSDALVEYVPVQGEGRPRPDDRR
jgi:hypothetical protein